MKIRINNKIYTSTIEHKQDLKDLQYLMIELGFEKISLRELLDMWYDISERRYAQFLNVPETSEELFEYLKEIEVD